VIVLPRPLLLLSLLSLLTALGTPLAAAEDRELRAILDKHVEAMGGWRNWNQVESIRLAGTIERDGRTVEFVIVKKRPNQIRATVTLPLPGDEEEKIQVIRAHDGKTAWTATRLVGAVDIKKQELDPEAAAALLADAGVLPQLMKFRQEGAAFELLPSAIFEGKPVRVIRSSGHRPEAGMIYEFHVCAETYRILHLVAHKGGGVERNTYGDYREADGVFLPFQTTIVAESTGRSEMRTESAEVGVGIYEEYFQSAATETPLVSDGSKR